jgi:4-amino-4-deoxychorismate lyase
MMRVDGIATAQLPVADRGLQYGDGLFETMRLHRSRVPLLDRHLARLAAGCRQLGMPYPGDQVLADEAAELADAAPDDGVLKIILTRGEGGRGYAPPPQAHGRRIVARYPLPPSAERPLSVGICRSRLGSSSALAGLKHLGRLEQVLAAAEAQAAGWDEGLMLDDSGNVVEATRNNLFYLRAGKLWTPPLEHSGVAGVMRALVLELLPGLGLMGGEAPLPVEELPEIEALLLCNAVSGPRRAGTVAGRMLGGADLLERLRGPLAAAGVTWSG